MPANYENITLGISDLDRIKLPKFQRGFVWTAAKKNDFVETLHKGFPFGALLVYPESQEADSKLVLLDGQQRLSTIQQYKNDPLKFWKPLNLDEYKETLASVNSLLAEKSQLDEKTFDSLVDGKDDLADWADEVADDKQVRKALRDYVKALQQKIAEYVDLESLGILAIKFIGSRDNIAEVFANLNKGGIPLSKYEIYSAAWVNTEINLLSKSDSNKQDEILQYVKNYYSDMECNAEFDLNDFSEDELSRTRTITLSEFGHALGSFVAARLGALVSKNTNAQKEIGFGLLGIITGVDNRQLGSLSGKTEEINGNLQLILERTDKICVDLQKTFSKLLGRMMAGIEDDYASGLTASFKTLSYFAALWSLDPGNDAYMTTLANIPSYYVYDFWAGNWTSHGDQRLLGYYPASRKRNYLTPLTHEQMKDAYSQWSADTTPSINFPKEVKALTTIHANLSYLSQTIPHGEDYELEHIIAKKLVNAAEDQSARKLFAGSLGNCMYLPKKLNNKKKEKNLYEVNENGKYDEVIERALYPTENDFVDIAAFLDDREFDAINSMILSRGNQVADAIIELLLKSN